MVLVIIILGNLHYIPIILPLSHYLMAHSPIDHSNHHRILVGQIPINSLLLVKSA